MIKDISYRYIVITSICLFTLCCNYKNIDYEKVTRFNIEFDGAKKEFHNKYNLWQSINERQNVEYLRKLISETKQKEKCNSIRPVMWQIDVFGNNQNGADKHLITLTSNTMNRISLIGKHEICYRNTELIEFLIELMKVEKIRSFNGKLTQENYNKL